MFERVEFLQHIISPAVPERKEHGMRRYDDPVEVRKGEVAGVEGPEEFLWRGRLWRVRATVAQWVETGPWWTSPGVRAVVGSDDDSSERTLRQAAAVPARRSSHGSGGVATLLDPTDVLAEREVWRVEAVCPREQALPVPPDEGPGLGVFDLVFSWTTGSWRLTACLD